MSAPIYAGGSPFFKNGIRTRARFIPSASAAVTILKGQTNSTFLFDSASAGITYTLPAPVVGLEYSFLSTVLQTGGTLQVVTSGTAVYMVGSVLMFSGEKVTPSSTLGPYQFNSPVSSTYVRLAMNATTTGGGIGTYFSVMCVSTTAWMVTGVINSPSGNLATPFAV